MLITIAKHSWLQLYNWVAMMIHRKNFACLNLQQNLQIWSPVFKDHVTTVSLLQEFSLNLKWQRHLCKKLILWKICEDHFITHCILNINPFIEKKIPVYLGLALLRTLTLHVKQTLAPFLLHSVYPQMDDNWQLELCSIHTIMHKYVLNLIIEKNQK